MRPALFLTHAVCCSFVFFILRLYTFLPQLCLTFGELCIHPSPCKPLFNPDLVKYTSSGGQIDASFMDQYKQERNTERSGMNYVLYKGIFFLTSLKGHVCYNVWKFLQTRLGPKTDSSVMEADQKNDPCQVSSP